MRYTNKILNEKVSSLNWLLDGEKWLEIEYAYNAQRLVERVDFNSHAIRAVSGFVSKRELAEIIDSIYNVVYGLKRGEKH